MLPKSRHKPSKKIKTFSQLSAQERMYLDLKKDGTLTKSGERKKKLRASKKGARRNG